MKHRQFTPEKIIGLLRQAEVELAQAVHAKPAHAGIFLISSEQAESRRLAGGAR
jgi:hypothetical protein